MKYTYLLACLVVLVSLPFAAHAEKAQPSAVNAAMQPHDEAMLIKRFQNCMEGDMCSLEERFTLAMDMEKELGDTTREMNRICREMDYTDCMPVQAARRKQWRSMYSRLGEVMGTMDPALKVTHSMSSEKMKVMGESMGQMEPAAGAADQRDYAPADEQQAQPTDQDDQNWWQRLWDNEEEPQTPEQY